MMELSIYTFPSYEAVISNIKVWYNKEKQPPIKHIKNKMSTIATSFLISSHLKGIQSHHLMVSPVMRYFGLY